MTGSEADRLGVRMALHLCKNQFEQCHDILKEAEAQFVVEGQNKKRKTPLAELDLDMRAINVLEKHGGCIYVEDLQWHDVDKLNIPNVGAVIKATLKRALDKHYRAKRLKEKQLGEEEERRYAVMAEGER